uniref:Dihydrofolate synthase/folylpolyglutamate synthase n=1 Tax=Magnetococcus massalia (strain MO-1) TaxID=451514 RepID=A0A1S7LK27_MAGMO|nr:Folylpolyglutamate synthetase [Candidatus Magnetococcus massalia]
MIQSAGAAKVGGPVDELLALSEIADSCQIEPGLTRITRLLNALGAPHQTVQGVIHVAGTNGKGSVLAYLSAILQAAAIPVAAFTSPHLITIHERLTFNGELVADTLLRQWASRVLACEAARQATFFERLTAVIFGLMAQWQQQQSKPSLLLLETGLGGRLDATNVVAKPRLTAITSIAADHQNYLGESIGQIAGEKAGIIKPGVPVFAAPNRPEAAQVIEQVAVDKGAPLQLLGRDFNHHLIGEGWCFEDRHGALELPLPGLKGAHQLDNAALALAMARDLGLHGAWPVTPEAMGQGVAQVRWPGRLERVSQRPEIWLDGAHNPAAAEQAAAFFAREVRPTIMLFAAMTDKDLEAMVAPWGGLVDEVILCDGLGDRAMATERMVEPWQARGITTWQAEDAATALALARQRVVPEGRIIASGSLYLVGALKSLI